MADTRAERLARRTSGRATTEPAANNNPRGRPRTNRASERDPEPRVEHPEDDGSNDDDGEGASSLHPSRSESASTQSRVAPSLATALLMAQELLRYRPTQAGHDN